jgi:hypothetical protein
MTGTSSRLQVRMAYSTRVARQPLALDIPRNTQAALKDARRRRRESAWGHLLKDSPRAERVRSPFDN